MGDLGAAADWISILFGNRHSNWDSLSAEEILIAGCYGHQRVTDRNFDSNILPWSCVHSDLRIRLALVSIRWPSVNNSRQISFRKSISRPALALDASGGSIHLRSLGTSGLTGKIQHA